MTTLGERTKKLDPRHIHCVLVILVVTLILFREAIFRSGVVLSHPEFLDLTHQFYPWRLFGFGFIRKGTVPLWNPYVFCGTPFAAHWHTALFYPLNLVFLVLPVNVALNYSIAFHLFLSGALTYAFAVRLIKERLSALASALVFMLSAPQVAHLYPGHIFNPLPWFPLTLLLAEKAVRSKRLVYYLLCGTVLALQVLAGLPQYMLYCLGALLLYLFWQAAAECRTARSAAPLGRAAAGAFIILAAGFSLSAVQLFPSLEFASHSSRALLSGPETVREVSLPPENLVTLLAPGFFGDMSAVRYWGRWLFWETCLYCGILPLILAAAGILSRRNRHTLFFAALAVLSLILAFGAYSPLFPFLYRFVPGFRLFRGNAKFIVLTAFSISILAGYGCRAALRPGEGTRKAIRAAAIVALALAALLILTYLAAALGGAEQSGLWTGVLHYRAARGFEGTPPLMERDLALLRDAYRVSMRGVLAAGLFAVLGGALLLAAASPRTSRALIGAAILAVILADLWHFGAKYVIVSPVSSCYWPLALARFIRADIGHLRVLAPSVSRPGANQNMNDRIFSIGGYQTNNIGAFKEYVDYSQGITPSEARVAFSIERVTPMLEALGLKYLLLPEGAPFLREGYLRRAAVAGTAIYEKNEPVPRAFICRRWEVAREKTEALERIRLHAADPTALVVFEEPPEADFRPGSSGNTADERVRFIRDDPGEVLLEVSLSAPGFLVLTDAYYPGWRVSVDGEAGRILRANHAFRAVEVEAGRHRVRFTYRPHSFRIGALTSLIALALLGPAFVFFSRAFESRKGR